MTQKEFKAKVHILHETMGVPYTEIGKRIGVSGQYISCMIKGKYKITPQILKVAENAEIFKNIEVQNND